MHQKCGREEYIEEAGEGNDSGGDEFQEAKGSFDMQGSSLESAEKVE